MHDHTDTASRPQPGEPARLTRRLPDEAATLALGADLARGLLPGMHIQLHGDLGAGKTTLVRGLLRALGHRGKVKSPTYTLVEVYKFSRLYFYHFDFYRLEYAQDWLHSGLAEYFGTDAVCIVEWPERAGGTLPPADIDAYLAFAAQGRDAVLLARSDAGRRCLSAIGP